MAEHGVEVDQSTINRWVVKFSPDLEKNFRTKKLAVRSSCRMDETHTGQKDNGSIFTVQWTSKVPL